MRSLVISEATSTFVGRDWFLVPKHLEGSLDSYLVVNTTSGRRLILCDVNQIYDGEVTYLQHTAVRFFDVAEWSGA